MWLVPFTRAVLVQKCLQTCQGSHADSDSWSFTIIESHRTLNDYFSHKWNVQNMPLTSNVGNQLWHVWCVKSASLVLHWSYTGTYILWCYLNCMSKPSHAHLRPYWFVSESQTAYLCLKYASVVSYAVFWHNLLKLMTPTLQREKQS